MVYIALERDEEARERAAEEQEQRDLELAKKLDMELNLAREEDRDDEVQGRETHRSDMPGGW